LSRKIFHTLYSIGEALEAIKRTINPAPRGVEEVELGSALGRVLAEDIYAPIDHPPFDRSEVDGYAVRSVDVEWADELAPVTLRVAGVVGVGEEPLKPCRPGEAVGIATGAMLPRGCDSVVMEEYTDGGRDSVKVYRSVSPGENVSTAGSDISAGDLVLLKGTRLGHEHIAVLAGLGLRSVRVYTKPRIAVYSTGNEIVEPGNPLPLGKVYDVNGYLVSSYLRELGAEAVFKGLLPDNYSSLRDAIERDLAEYDAVVTSGGTSAGEGDLVYRVFEDLGEIIVHGLKTKPGKPTVIAVSRGKLLIGLPGFPLSCYMILRGLVKPVVSWMTGARDVDYVVEAELPLRVRKQVGKAWLIPVSLVEGRYGYSAYPVSLSSGSIASLIYSDGFIELPEDVDVAEAGSRVRVVLFKPGTPPPRLNIIGSNDPLLMDILRESGLAYSSRVLNVGSLAGWHSVARGEADVAPTHLLDEETLRYNTPFLKRYGLEGKAVLIRGFDRLIGLVVAKGNPKNIQGIRDLLRSDVRIVNRTKGSGIRVYLDYMLRKVLEEEKIPFKRVSEVVNGYTYEVKTHTAVALAVRQGRADVGIASGYVAEMFNLDFIPLTWEEYDFLVPRDRLERKLVKEFIESLRDRNLVSRAMRYQGYYRIPSDIGEPRSF